MSYCDQVGKLLAALAHAGSIREEYQVCFVRTGSFDVKVTVSSPGPVRERTFDLSGGLTPGVWRAIRDWFLRAEAPDESPQYRKRVQSRLRAVTPL